MENKTISTTEATSILGIKERRIRDLCKAGRIPGAMYEKKAWRLPANPIVLPPASGRARPGKVKFGEQSNAG